MSKYNHKKIEKKWQKKWEESEIYRAEDFSKKPKFYGLIEFPYPSGEGLHVGHVRSNTAMDIIARKRRAEGYNVLYPIGWDAFGLPTENYAIKTGAHPVDVTKKNTDIFRRQLKSIGFSFDWSREINTTDPKYYKWTQWIFLQLLKKGLAYKAKIPINWCLSCKIGLANEEVVDGKCERCGGDTEQIEKEQWMLAITKYADRLDKDLDDVDFLEKIKIQQRNWIGKSDGAEIEFKINCHKSRIKVFTTRPDTLFGSTYCVLSPEHKLLDEIKDKIENWGEVEKYKGKATAKTEIERTAESKEKTGVELKGVKAINPANKEEVPIFISDYVLAHYGTGAIMAVPAHDERDFEFAKKFGLPIRKVILPPSVLSMVRNAEDIAAGVEKELFIKAECWEGEGILVNSGKFDGMKSEDAKSAITKFAGGEIKTTYKLRDWVFSRQRYWGEPIPVIYCEKCGTIPVSEDELPVKLPDVENYKPTETGESPLASIDKWVNTSCPKCGGEGKRETDTMPNWAGSSWYYLRYADPQNDKKLADQKKLKYWTPVDWYNGGMEHTTLHLLYSRFWHKFLFDLGVVSTSEPYQKRTSHGMILAEGGVKMSKSKGNVLNPDDIVDTYGADTLRVYEMFMGPFDQSVAWSTESIIGPRRFLERVWKLKENLNSKNENSKLEQSLHKTIKKVSEDIESFDFNTAISQMMIFVNEAEKEGFVKKQYEAFLKILAPFTPHISEELWEELGNKKSIHLEPWPKYDEKKIKEETATIAVQVNGKIRGTFDCPAGLDEEEIKKRAVSLPNVKKWTEGKEIKKIIVVPNKLVSLVVS